MKNNLSFLLFRILASRFLFIMLLVSYINLLIENDTTFSSLYCFSLIITFVSLPDFGWFYLKDLKDKSSKQDKELIEETKGKKE